MSDKNNQQETNPNEDYQKAMEEAQEAVRKEQEMLKAMTPEEIEELRNENIQKWLDTEIDMVVGFEKDEKGMPDQSKPIMDKTTILKHLTILVVCNQFNYSVTGWGVMIAQDAGNPYGNYGLDQRSALTLMNYHSVIVGASIALDKENDAKWLHANLYSRTEAIYEKDLEEFKNKVLSDPKDPRREWFTNQYPESPSLN